MQTIFDQGILQNIPAVLANKDQRVQVQEKLLAVYPTLTVVAAKLNIPGPIKNNELIEQFFVRGINDFEQRLLAAGLVFNIKEEWLKKGTGPEKFYLVEAPATIVKSLTTAFEESKASYRLFDLDVLMKGEAGIRSLSRADTDQLARRCLICGRFAKECGRARRHSVAELQEKVSTLVTNDLGQKGQEQLVDQLVQFAQRALLYEVSAWPKPGLVDPQEHAAHPDMDVFTFINSSLSLQKYLTQAAQLGLFTTSSNLTAIFAELREFGKKAERAMFQATAGVNTHKGAVFSLGIFVTAVGYSLHHQKNFNTADIQRTIKAMLVDLIYDDLRQLQAKKDLTAGEKQYLKYGLSGIRGEAHKGYPTVFDYGLPTFLATPGDWNSRIVATLLELSLHTEDSTLIKRAGTPAIMEWKDQQIIACQQLGGITTAAGRQKLREIEQAFSQRKLSLGGTADLLIVTIFLGLVKEGLIDEPDY